MRKGGLTLSVQFNSLERDTEIRKQLLHIYAEGTVGFAAYENKINHQQSVEFDINIKHHIKINES